MLDRMDLGKPRDAACLAAWRVAPPLVGDDGGKLGRGLLVRCPRGECLKANQ